MNILLIYPKFPDTFWSFKYALPFVRKRAAFPPLGLLTVAALLPDKFQKRLVDVNVDCLTNDDLSWADLAFIGSMAVQRESAKRIIAQCKFLYCDAINFMINYFKYTKTTFMGGDDNLMHLY